METQGLEGVVKEKKQQWDLCKPTGSALEISLMKVWDYFERDFIEEKKWVLCIGRKVSWVTYLYVLISPVLSLKLCICHTSLPYHKSCSEVKHQKGKVFGVWLTWAAAGAKAQGSLCTGRWGRRGGGGGGGETTAQNRLSSYRDHVHKHSSHHSNSLCCQCDAGTWSQDSARYQLGNCTLPTYTFLPQPQ